MFLDQFPQVLKTQFVEFVTVPIHLTVSVPSLCMPGSHHHTGTKQLDHRPVTFFVFRVADDLDNLSKRKTVSGEWSIIISGVPGPLDPIAYHYIFNLCPYSSGHWIT